MRRIKQYLDYTENCLWDETLQPTILMVTTRQQLNKRLRKRIAYELRQSYEELTFATTTLTHLLNHHRQGTIWLPVDQEGDDPDEPLPPVSLADLPKVVKKPVGYY